MKVGFVKFDLLHVDIFLLVGCMPCPVGGAEGTRCHSAMGGEASESRIHQGLGARCCVSFNKYCQKILT